MKIKCLCLIRNIQYTVYLQISGKLYKSSASDLLIVNWIWVYLCIMLIDYWISVLTLICIIFVGIDCYKPANGESVTIETTHNIHVDIPLSLLKREASKTGLDELNMFWKFLYITFYI